MRSLRLSTLCPLGVNQSAWSMITDSWKGWEIVHFNLLNPIRFHRVKGMMNLSGIFLLKVKSLYHIVTLVISFWRSLSSSCKSLLWRILTISMNLSLSLPRPWHFASEYLVNETRYYMCRIKVHAFCSLVKKKQLDCFCIFFFNCQFVSHYTHRVLFQAN